MLNFRYASANDVQLYFKWANDVLVRKNSINPEQIKLEDHIDWFNRKVSHPDVFMYLFSNEDNEPVGKITIERKGDWVFLSQSVAKEHRGKKYSTEMLTTSTNDFLSKFPEDTIVTAVISTNIASLKMSEKSGFNVVAPDSKAHNHLVFKGYKQNDDDYITKYQRIFNEV